MPPKFFTISEFSALVSAALDSSGSSSDATPRIGYLSPNGTDVGKLDKARLRFLVFMKKQIERALTGFGLFRQVLQCPIQN
jgi:hypothetical protein